MGNFKKQDHTVFNFSQKWIMLLKYFKQQKVTVFFYLQGGDGGVFSYSILFSLFLFFFLNIYYCYSLVSCSNN